MANPILEAMNRNSAQRTTPAPNSQAQTAQNNPFTAESIQAAEATIRQYGGDGRQAFYAECQRRGIDPNQALPQIQAMFNQIYGGNAK